MSETNEASVQSVCYADCESAKLAERLAERTVHQWEKHDRYRMTEGERVLFEDELDPNDVVVARMLLACLHRMRLARMQYLGCGGSLKPNEVVDAIHAILDGE